MGNSNARKHLNFLSVKFRRSCSLQVLPQHARLTGLALLFTRASPAPLRFAPSGCAKLQAAQASGHGSTKEKAMTKSKFDVHTEITSQIIARLEEDLPCGRNPWISPRLKAAINITSKNTYQGINWLSLLVTADKRGYGDNTWERSFSGKRSEPASRKVNTLLLLFSFPSSNPQKRKTPKMISAGLAF
jgi:N-terminal domain of anti-restriction factor ArdC